MKRVLVLQGSPKPKGHTARMAETFLQPFVQAGISVEVFDSYGEMLRPCMACGWCASHEECAIHDSGDRLDRLLRECDLLVVASPVYNLSFPAPLKAVLDRFQRYFEARFSLGKKPAIEKHRKAVLLVSAGANCREGVDIMEKQLRQSFSVMNTDLTDTVSWLCTDGGEEGWKEAKLALERLSLALFREIC